MHRVDIARAIVVSTFIAGGVVLLIFDHWTAGIILLVAAALAVY